MSSESNIRFLAILGIVIGVAGAGAGGTAIYFHMKDGEAAARLETRLAGMDQKIGVIPGDVTRVENDLRSQIQGQAQNAAQMQDSAIGSVRMEISQLRDQLAALTNKPAPVDPPPAAPEAAPAGPGGTYVIQSGDTFGKIAKKSGTTSAAIQTANPDVDPARLKIGQTINLP